MPYEERYVAFIDILGFSQAVIDSGRDKSNESFNVLAKALEGIRTRDSDYDQVFGDDFQFQTFSDSIVMSEKASPTGLFQIIESIEGLALDLLNAGLLIRGGLAKGLLYHKDSAMFGPAFLEAYRIESSIAKYPRVVLSREVFEDVEALNRRTSNNSVLLAEDGPPYVNVLKSLTQEQFRKKHGDKVQNYRATLQALLGRAMYEPNHFEKLKWYMVYWNSVLGNEGVVMPPYAMRPPGYLKVD